MNPAVESTNLETPEPSTRDRLVAVIQESAAREDIDSGTLLAILAYRIHTDTTLDTSFLIGAVDLLQNRDGRAAIEETLALALQSSGGRDAIINELEQDVSRELLNRLVSDSEKGIEAAIRDGKPEDIRRALENAQTNAKVIFDRFAPRLEDGSPVTLEDFKSDSPIFGGMGQERGHPDSQSIEQLVSLRNWVTIGEIFLELGECARVNSGRLARDRATYGAKGAHLNALMAAREELAPLLKKCRLEMEVPPFTLIPLSAYDAHLAGTQAPELGSAYEWIGGREVLLRSSAAYSEDGEHMGAGVYSTVKLEKNASFERFLRGVHSVYDSVDTPLAIDYRARIGVTKERMGIVVQEFREGDKRGYVNTMRRDLPEIIEIVFEGTEFEDGFGDDDYALTPVLFHRDRLPRLFQGGTAFDIEFAYAVPTDITRESNHYHHCRIARLSLILERYFQHPSQLEFVVDGANTAIVQARPLPPGWTNSKVVTFPLNERHIWRSDSIGVMDEVLPILDNRPSNSSTRGLVIIPNGAFLSDHLAWLERVLPREGAVMLMTKSEMMRGNVESRCLERGLVLLTGDTSNFEFDYLKDGLDVFSAAYGRDVSHLLEALPAREPNLIGPSEQLKSIRVVSTGLEARCYLPAQAPTE